MSSIILSHLWGHHPECMLCPQGKRSATGNVKADTGYALTSSEDTCSRCLS